MKLLKLRSTLSLWWNYVQVATFLTMFVNVAVSRSHLPRRSSARSSTVLATSTRRTSPTEISNWTISFLMVKATSRLQTSASQGRSSKTKSCESSAVLRPISPLKSFVTADIVSMLTSGVPASFFSPCYMAPCHSRPRQWKSFISWFSRVSISWRRISLLRLVTCFEGSWRLIRRDASRSARSTSIPG